MQAHWYSTPLRQLCLTSWHGRLGLKQCKKQNEEQGEFPLPKPVVALWSTVDHHLLQFPLNIGHWETFLLFSSFSHGVVLHIYYLFPRICYLYVHLCSCEARHPFQWFPAAITRLFPTCGWSGVTWKIQQPEIQGAFPSAYKSSQHGKGLHCSLLCCAQMYDILHIPCSAAREPLVNRQALSVSLA